MKIYIDFETRSTVDLKKVGVWEYAKHPTTDILCMAYRVRDGETAPRTGVTFGDIFVPVTRDNILTMADIKDGVQLELPAGTTLVAHNAHFEFAIYNEILVKRYGWPPMDDPESWDCTLARAAICNLPISLDLCGQALGIDAKKDMVGRQAMMKLCKPELVTVSDDGTKTFTFCEDPVVLDTLYNYCLKDVAAEMEIDARLPAITASEKRVWNLDLDINRRGVKMDTELAAKAEALVSGLTANLNQTLTDLTNGAVSEASRVAEIKRWLKTQGVAVASLDKQAVNDLLARPDISPLVKKVLDIRRQVGKTSTSKYTAIRRVASSKDQRARGLLQYHGASTGRWAGRLIQPHNFPKGVSQSEQTLIIDAIMDCDENMFGLMFGDEAMDKLSGALRGTLVAGEGKTLVVADYSSIEPRVLFWLAGDERALEMYRKGEDLYIDLARFIFQNPKLTKKDAKERNVGKMGILGCGYGMGKVRFQAQCATFGIQISEDLAAQAVRAYRDKYSSVKNMWYEVAEAAKRSIRNPGSINECCGGKVHFGMDRKREFLVCRLPSGRVLRYYKPYIVAGEMGDEICYMGPGLGGALEVQRTYGGSLVENIVQAIARDIMAHGMLNVGRLAGPYDIVLTVHDEVVAETHQWVVSPDLFVSALCDLPTWASGCPIAAEGWVGKRYRK